MAADRSSPDIFDQVSKAVRAARIASSICS